MTDFKSEQIEKDIAETIQNIKMLERQIVSKTDMRFSTFNIYNLGEVPKKDKDKRKKFILERSASDKHLISKNPSKQLFRLVRTCFLFLLISIYILTLHKYMCQ